jgi:hypothetical protein
VSAPTNPDIVILPNGDLQLTLAIDKINSDYDRRVRVEGSEATYEERRRAHFGEAQSHRPFPDRATASFTVPLEIAKGYGIGAIVMLTIARPEPAAEREKGQAAS